MCAASGEKSPSPPGSWPDEHSASRLKQALARDSKIVGVSRDFERLAKYETAVRAALVAAAGHRLRLGLEAIVKIGGMENNAPMFARSGLGIAMPHASPAVKARAHAETALMRRMTLHMLSSTRPNTFARRVR